ncbi:endopeptidase La [bacterium]|nr:endopeptidase La [bacterium]
MSTQNKDIRDLHDEVDAPPGALVPVERAALDPGQEEKNKEVDSLVILPVKNSVLFPHNVVPVTPTAQWGHDALERAARKGTPLGIVALRDNAQEPIRFEDLYSMGTEAKIIKVIRFPDGTAGAVVQGLRRFRVASLSQAPGSPIMAVVEFPNEVTPEESLELSALQRGLKQLIQRAVSLSPNIPNEANIFIENVSDAQYLADLVVPYLSIDTSEKQALLETENVVERLRRVQLYLTREIEILEMSQRIQSEIKGEVGKQQRRFYVKEQLKLLQKELGDLDGKTTSSAAQEPQELKERVEKSAMPTEARTAAVREIDRMAVMQSGSPEYTVSHSYVNWLLDIPWGVYTQSKIDLAAARKLLDSEHHGLEKVKKRVLEFLAVYALKGHLKGPILLLVGPPGVGKTSLGKSVAKALGRKFHRIALGGVRDESEIRGHRRTYIGSMPGKIADALKKAGSMDPVILLDEVDKISADVRGDPSSALLEVLDSEQNHTFTDHYLNVPLDLSRVLFIGTANTLATLQGPLRDRMEVVQLDSYTLEEKVSIAQKHLLPQVSDEHGLLNRLEFSLSDGLLADVIRGYTHEAGVRQLRRELAALARGLVHEYVETTGAAAVSSENLNSQSRKISRRPSKKRALTRKDVDKILGPVRFIETLKRKSLPLGVSTGLAYTPVGGDVLHIESVRIDSGKGHLTVTGQLGDVMKESVHTALALVKSKAALCGVELQSVQRSDIHIHFPAGAVKKDGPSAGVAVFAALVGLFSGRALPSDLAMTGEISLGGDVLAVGGIKEKLLAAHRYGVKKVIVPHDNLRDLDELPITVRKSLVIQGVKRVEEVLEAAFGKKTSTGVRKSGRISRS